MDYRERWELKDYLFRRILDRRIFLFHIGLILLLLGFLLNFWYLQGIHGKEYASLAENNRLRRLPMNPSRGVIFDRHGQVIASTRPSLDLLLRREGAPDLTIQLKRLAAVVDEPLLKLQERLNAMRHRPLFEPLLVKEDVKLRQVAVIEARRELYPSVEIHQSARRHYPLADMPVHAIGYVGEVSESQLTGEGSGGLARGDIVGKSGIERSYDELVRGRRGWKLVSVNNLGRQMGESWVEREPDHGEPLVLTIDMELQRELMEAMKGETGAGVFMNPTTGEVLAIASSPAFDPNRFADGISHEDWGSITEDSSRPLHDRAIASFYAPGSTFKVVMAVAGLETGTITAEERRYCNGSTTIYGRRRLCWKRGGHGWVNMHQALAESCNVYFYHLGKELGIDAITAYSRMFGIGSPTGIDLPGEESGILPSSEWKQRVQREQWYPGDTISVAIGQGLLAVTPTQMATLISAVATGGEMVQPRLLMNGSSGSRTLDISKSTMDIVREALRLAVTEGTGRAATGGKFTVAGKTGTAQVYKHSAGIDSAKLPKEERDHAWFVGYAPADDPEIAFAVIIEHGGHGGTAAAPVVRRVLEVFFEGQEEEAGEEGTVVRASATR
jgi:penicillin-binding protein 2